MADYLQDFSVEPTEEFKRDIETVEEIVKCFGAHERLYLQQKAKERDSRKKIQNNSKEAGTVIYTDEMLVCEEDIACIKEMSMGTMVILKSGVHLNSDIDMGTWAEIMETREDLPMIEIMSVDEEKFQDLIECLDPECEVKIEEDEIYCKFDDGLIDAPEGSIVTEIGVYAPVKVYKAVLKG